MKLPFWLIALVFAGYTVWAVRFWHCNECQCCNGDAPAVVQQTTGVPLFRWDAAKPESDKHFADWKKNLLKQGGQGDTLVITGWYRAGEMTTKEGDLGLSRAMELRAMMQPEMPESRVLVGSLEVQDSLASGGPAMESAAFSWRTMTLAKEETKVTIIESDKDVIFLFPFNSAERIRDAGVDDYLRKLVDKHKSGTSTFGVVGHTDNIGEDAANIKLGRARAESVARVLREFGIDKSRRKVDSKGESEPAADNATEEGQRKNRRVVLTVNN
jgi:outer membrane protein OmpA-like peptidoglycan-associated protein